MEILLARAGIERGFSSITRTSKVCSPSQYSNRPGLTSSSLSACGNRALLDCVYAELGEEVLNESNVRRQPRTTVSKRRARRSGSASSGCASDDFDLISRQPTTQRGMKQAAVEATQKASLAIRDRQEEMLHQQMRAGLDKNRDLVEKYLKKKKSNMKKVQHERKRKKKAGKRGVTFDTSKLDKYTASYNSYWRKYRDSLQEYGRLKNALGYKSPEASPVPSLPDTPDSSVDDKSQDGSGNESGLST